MRVWLAAGVAVAAASFVTNAQGATRSDSAATTAAAAATPTISAPADMIVGEGDGTIDLIVKLSQTSDSPVSVHYQTNNSSAAGAPSCFSSGDFIPTGGTLTIPAGQTTGDIPVSILDCSPVEPFESFTLDLTLPSGAILGRASTRIGIVDNDTLAATPLLFIRDTVVDEADGTAHIPVLMGGPTGQASTSTVTVDYTTSNGTATAGSDYVTKSQKLTFAAGETVQTIDVQITNDNAAEAAETFTVTLSNPSLATIADGTATVVIGANDSAETSLPNVSVQPNTVVGEGDGFMDVVVSLSAPPMNPVLLDFTTANSSAGGATSCFSSGDFVGTSSGEHGKLRFAPDETTTVVRIDILDCTSNPPDPYQSFTFNVSLPAGTPTAAIARDSTRIGIVNNDTLVPTPRLFVRNAVVDEKDGFARVAVLLGGPSGERSTSPVAVNYATSGHTATAGSDYTTVNGQLTFWPGQTLKTIVVPIADDGVPEAPEDFLVTLSGASNATLGRATGVVVIGGSAADASPVPDIYAPQNALVGERDGFVDLVVTLAQPPVNPVSVHFTTANGSAGGATSCFSSGDFVGTSGTLNFATGETTKLVRVDIVDCAVVEPLEFFTFNLSAPVGGTIIRASTRIEIVDNDVAPALNSISVTPANPTTSVGGDVQFVATGNYSNGSTPDLTQSVAWASSNVSAATVSAGGLAHPVFPGTATISATAPLILALGPVSGSTTLTVDHQQMITFPQPADRIYGAADFSVNPTASSGLAVVLLPPSGKCTLSGTTVHITGAGTCTLTASQAGDANFNAAPDVSRTFTIAKANQTINFGALAAKTVTDPDFGISANATSGLAVSFSSSTTAVCTVTGATVHLTGAGTCTITATQGGDANFNAAPNASQSFTVAKGNQTISFGALANKTFGDADFTVSATASSGLTVTFSPSGNCSVSIATVHISAAGSCTITASQSGNASFNGAPSVPQTFAIAKADQTITVSTHAPSSAAGGSTFSVFASAPGGSVSYSSSGACTNSGSFFTTNSSGATCSVKYDQAGNSNYNVATTVTESVTVTVTGKLSQVITITTSVPSSAGVGTSFTVAATAPGGAVVYSSSGACTNSGATFTAATTTGTCTVKYDQPGNTNYNAAPQKTESVSVSKRDQTITVTKSAPSHEGTGKTFTVAANATGGAVTYSSSGACTNSGATFTTASKNGTCVVKYDQAGNATYNAAPQVTESVDVSDLNPACSVPRVVGKTLAAAKQAITRAGCVVGLVTYTYSSRKKGTVVSQSRQGSSTVDLVISAGPVPAAVLKAHITNNCTRVTARLLLARNRLGDLGDPKLRDSVGQVLCGTFFGKRSRGMAVSLAIPSCGRTGGWVVFRWNGRAWKLVMRQKHGADLGAVGSQIRETQFIFRSGDTHCNPSGGTRSRLWRWNGSRFVAGRWQRSR